MSGWKWAAARPCSSVKDLGQGLKVEHLETGLADHGQVSFYRQGDFLDLCRGPHVPSAGAIGAFKLLNVAGAYWKGDAQRQQLQRLYGTAWFNKQDMEAYLRRSKRPNAAITACWASNWSCSLSTPWSVRG